MSPSTSDEGYPFHLSNKKLNDDNYHYKMISYILYLCYNVCFKYFVLIIVEYWAHLHIEC